MLMQQYDDPRDANGWVIEWIHSSKARGTQLPARGMATSRR